MASSLRITGLDPKCRTQYPLPMVPNQKESKGSNWPVPEEILSIFLLLVPSGGGPINAGQPKSCRELSGEAAAFHVNIPFNLHLESSSLPDLSSSEDCLEGQGKIELNLHSLPCFPFSVLDSTTPESKGCL